ncbi:hypothetical protein Bca101_031377 [Brassica carinata]
MKAQGWITTVTTRSEHKALQKIISRRVQNMGISPRPLSTSGKLILLQAQTRPRPKKNSEKGKQCPVHDKHVEMERLRLAKVHMFSPDFTHEIER